MYWYAKIRFFIHNLKINLLRRKPKIIVPMKPTLEENDSDLVNKVGNYYIELFLNDNSIQFNKYEEIVLYANLFINELASGTFSGLMYHAGNEIEQIIEALTEINLNSYVLILKNILSKFPNNKYEEDKMNNKIEDYCNSLKYDIDEIENAIKKYIIENSDYLLKRQ